MEIGGILEMCRFNLFSFVALCLISGVVACERGERTAETASANASSCSASEETAEGVRLFEAGQLEPAFERLNAAIQCDKDYLDAYLRRGFVLQKLRLVERAISDFSRVLQGTPDNPAAHLARGSAFLELGMLAPALRDLTAAIDLAPTDLSTGPETYLLRGKAHLGLRNTVEACRDFARACELGRCEKPASEHPELVCEELNEARNS